MKSPPNRTLLPAERPQKPLSKPLFYASISVTLACTALLITMALRGVPTEELGYAPHLLILLVVAIFVVASLAITEIIPWHSRSLRDWQRPKVLGSFVVLIMGSLGLAAGLTPIFNPPAATEKTVEEVRKRLEEAGVTRGATSLVERHINGIWGEPGCLVTYEVALDKGLLSVESRKSVAGQSPLKMELQAEPGMGSRLVTSVVFPLNERGDQHEFRYQQAGAREFLTWLIKKREISLQLDRCRQG
jgi:hypothetical protein